MSNLSEPPSPRVLDYAIVDVFAEQVLEGNPLAIFADARSLSSAEMQRIARETNLSETTFILPRSPEIEAKCGVHVRIFTTEEELPFAGHPTLGTASWLHANHPRLRGSETIELELAGGRIPVRFGKALPGQRGTVATMRQNDPVFGATHNAAEVAAVLNLSPEDLDASAPLQTVSTGIAFCIVPLRSLEVAQRLQTPQQLVQPWLRQNGAKFFYCLTRAGAGSGAAWHARMQFYNGEDPATGSAAGCAIAWMVRHGLARSGEELVIEQGVEILRPSRIHVQARLSDDDGRVTDVFVGGRTIPVASGQLFLP